MSEHARIESSGSVGDLLFPPCSVVVGFGLGNNSFVLLRLALEFGLALKVWGYSQVTSMCDECLPLSDILSLCEKGETSVRLFQLELPGGGLHFTDCKSFTNVVT